MSGLDVIALGIAVIALGISIYLTVEHYDSSLTLACPESATVNCAKVTTSRWSSIAGVPVALLGLLYFAVMAVLLAIPRDHPRLLLARVLGASAGVLMVLWLVYVELLLVNAICLWCTAVHVLTVALFVVVLWRWLTPASENP